jgi:hypothetical protein
MAETIKPLINLNGWQTIKSYATARNVSTQYISKLIKQGKLDTYICPQLNNLKLVKEKATP